MFLFDTQKFGQSLLLLFRFIAQIGLVINFVVHRAIILFDGCVEIYFSHKNNVKICTSWQNVKSLLNKPRNNSNTFTTFSST